MKIVEHLAMLKGIEIIARSSDPKTAEELKKLLVERLPCE
jgi:hypothetical protein